MTQHPVLDVTDLTYEPQIDIDIDTLYRVQSQFSYEMWPINCFMSLSAMRNFNFL